MSFDHRGDQARRTRVRDRHTPIQGQSEHNARSLGDPRGVPFDARPSRIRFWIRTGFQAASLILFVAAFWRMLP